MIRLKFEEFGYKIDKRIIDKTNKNEELRYENEKRILKGVQKREDIDNNIIDVETPKLSIPEFMDDSFSEYVKIEAEGKVIIIAKEANVREDVSIHSSIIGTVKDGEVYNYYNRTPSAVEIFFRGRRGWVSDVFTLEYKEPEEISPIVALQMPVVKKTFKTAFGIISGRVELETDYKPIEIQTDICFEGVNVDNLVYIIEGTFLKLMDYKSPTILCVKMYSFVSIWEHVRIEEFRDSYIYAYEKDDRLIISTGVHAKDKAEIESYRVPIYYDENTHKIRSRIENIMSEKQNRIMIPEYFHRHVSTVIDDFDILRGGHGNRNISEPIVPSNVAMTPYQYLMERQILAGRNMPVGDSALKQTLINLIKDNNLDNKWITEIEMGTISVNEMMTMMNLLKGSETVKHKTVPKNCDEINILLDDLKATVNEQYNGLKDIIDDARQSILHGK